MALTRLTWLIYYISLTWERKQFPQPDHPSPSSGLTQIEIRFVFHSIKIHGVECTQLATCGAISRCFYCCCCCRLILLIATNRIQLGSMEFLVAIQVRTPLEPLETIVTLKAFEILTLLALMQHKAILRVVISSTLAQQLILWTMPYIIWGR